MANDDIRDDIKALIAIAKSLDVNIAALLKVMRDIHGQIERIESGVDELRRTAAEEDVDLRLR